MSFDSDSNILLPCKQTESSSRLVGLGSVTSSVWEAQEPVRTRSERPDVWKWLRKAGALAGDEMPTSFSNCRDRYGTYLGLCCESLHKFPKLKFNSRSGNDRLIHFWTRFWWWIYIQYMYYRPMHALHYRHRVNVGRMAKYYRTITYCSLHDTYVLCVIILIYTDQ